MLLFIWATIICIFQSSFVVIAQPPVGFISIQKCRQYQQELPEIELPSRINVPTSTLDPDRVIFAKNTRSKERVIYYPYAASIHAGSGRTLCGGTLISDRFILLAAHCLKNTFASVEYVQLGSDISEPPKPNFLNISRRIPHPQFTDKLYYNDIGLIELAEPVRFSKTIRPACLQARRYIDGDDWFMLTWYSEEINGKYVYKRKKFNVKAMKMDECQQTFQDRDSVAFGIIEHLQICVEEEIDPKASHTPISIAIANKDMPGFTVVGTTSIGIRRQNTGQVYTRVSGYIKWIESIVWPNISEKVCNNYIFDVNR